MGKQFLSVISLCAFAFTAIQPAQACTTVAIPTSTTKVVGNSLDWDDGSGMVVINQSGVSKTAMLVDTTQTPAKWTSKYGSLTFNLYGREFPLGGMNEKGLVVENMWLTSSIYPKADTTPALNELQWIQFQLDQADTTEKAIELAKSVRVANAYATLHYLICDRAGSCATFEYVAGKLTIHTGEQLPLQTLTNSTYKDSMTFASKHKGLGGTLEIPQSKESLDRFVRASSQAKAYDAEKHGDAVAYTFDVLKSVSQGNYSKWNLVYERDGKFVHYRTLAANKIKSVDVTSFNYACKTGKASKMLDLNAAEISGEVTKEFKDYTAEANTAQVKNAFKVIGQFLPNGMVEKIAKYPDTTTCVN